MKELIFDYLLDFKCIASKCKHNCCIGWQIDIDKKSLNYYRNYQGEFAKNIKNGINFGERAFKMNNNRCYFLDENNLCKIIKNMGEDKLCQVCTDHPRFRNFFNGRVETGLGLCCEEACKIVLSKTEPAKLIVVKDDKEHLTVFEKQKLAFRDKLINIVIDRSKSFNERLNILQSMCKENMLSKDGKYFYDRLVCLERYDKKWDDVLQFLLNNDKQTIELGIPFENLLSYFIYRHIPRAENENDLILRLEFCLFSFMVIKLLCESNSFNIEDLIEYARMYSAEIEYSKNNTKNILDRIKYKR